MSDNLSIWTIGHSTRSIEEFLVFLKAHEIRQLVDIRTIPKSRRYPHFNSDQLAGALADSGISYTHLKELGGLRKPRPDSQNLGWRNESFRGYADYMATADFRSGLDRLLRIAESSPTAIMCAEAVPWRCHRNLVSDALVLLYGVRVLHIMAGTKAEAHVPNDFAKSAGDVVTYPVKLEDDLFKST